MVVKNMIKDFVVIGAGLSGLNIARSIKDMDLGEVLILEKSRGIGGRMATRRALNTRFDHGAQFYRLTEDIEKLHRSWSHNKINHRWFESSRGSHWCARLGLTSLAKSLAEGIEVALEKQIISIEYENQSWKIVSDKGEIWYCNKLIITSPLPQAIKLIESVIASQKVDLIALNEIKNINYTKAVIGLITLEENLLTGVSGYEEFQNESIFSISNQKEKGISDTPALVITMAPSFSEQTFEQSDDLILEKILYDFKIKYPDSKIVSAELKKWRYCQPTSQYKKYFLEITSNIFLIGDAFGGSSLLGTVRSSNALFDYLLNSEEPK